MTSHDEWTGTSYASALTTCTLLPTFRNEHCIFRFVTPHKLPFVRTEEEPGTMTSAVTRRALSILT
jgi:hypothetical protein